MMMENHARSTMAMGQTSRGRVRLVLRSLVARQPKGSAAPKAAKTAVPGRSCVIGGVVTAANRAIPAAAPATRATAPMRSEPITLPLASACSGESSGRVCTASAAGSGYGA